MGGGVVVLSVAFERRQCNKYSLEVAAEVPGCSKTSSFHFPVTASLPVAEEKWFGWELSDAPGGNWEPPVDVRVVRVRRIIWHKVGRGAGEAIAVRLGTGTC